MAHTGIKPVSAGLEAAAQSLYQWDLIYCEHKWTSTIILLIRRIKNHMLYVLRECLLMFLCLIKSTSSITKFKYIDTTNNLNTYSGRDAISVPHLITTHSLYYLQFLSSIAFCICDNIPLILFLISG